MYKRQYTSRALHELVIGGDNLLQWADAVGFADTAKAQRLAAALQAYRRSLNRERFTATVAALTPCGEQDVYDVTVADVHAFDANGLVVHNCAEQPLPPYGCCCLGSIDLTRFVRDAFEPTARFDEAAFAKVAQVAVRMLDNVLDTTVWPLPQQQEEASRKRRIGLGFTGLGDALVMLGLRYDETPAREKAARISEVLRDAAYEADVYKRQEQDLEVRGDGQQLAQQGFGFGRNANELLAAVAHFHHAHAAAVPVQHFGGCLAQHGFGQRSRAGAEVEDAGHVRVGFRASCGWGCRA